MVDEVIQYLLKQKSLSKIAEAFDWVSSILKHKA